MDKVFLGDCADILPNLNVQPDLILTSPPYDNLRDYGGHGFDFDSVADALVSVMPEGGVLVWIVADATIEGSETGTSFRQALGFMERGLKLHQTMFYQKAREILQTPTRYPSVIEYMFVFTKGQISDVNLLRDKPNVSFGNKQTNQAMGRTANGVRSIRAGQRITGELGCRINVWRYPVNERAPDFKDAYQHPAIFPIALARDHILTWTNPGDIVLDPMAGSGTTLRAAKDLNRHFVGIEIHETYVDLIYRRIAQEVMDLSA